MLRETEERERPAEWLRSLHERPSGYDELLAATGDLVAAAYRIALARHRSSARGTAVPTVREVDAALREIVERIEARPRVVPPRARLGGECADRGLLVIARDAA